MKVAVYAGRMCQVEDLGPLVRQLFEDESNNVRNAEGMYEIGSLSGAPLEEDAIPSRTLVWKKLLEHHLARICCHTFDYILGPSHVCHILDFLY